MPHMFRPLDPSPANSLLQPYGLLYFPQTHRAKWPWHLPLSILECSSASVPHVPLLNFLWAFAEMSLPQKERLLPPPELAFLFILHLFTLLYFDSCNSLPLDDLWHMCLLLIIHLSDLHLSSVGAGTSVCSLLCLLHLKQYVAVVRFAGWMNGSHGIIPLEYTRERKWNLSLQRTEKKQ